MKKTKKAFSSSMILLIASMLIATIPINNVAIVCASGPRSDLDFRFYGTPGAAFAALFAGAIDIMCYPLDSTQKPIVEATPGLQIASYEGMDIYGFDLNNNYTINDYPGVRNPLNEKSFRQAIAHAVNKGFIVATPLGGLATQIDVPIPAPQLAWWNSSVTGASYPYPYSLTTAGALLAANGFVDTDADGILNYPVGWPGREAGSNLDPLIIYQLTDSNTAWGTIVSGPGVWDLTTDLTTLGIPTTLIAATKDVSMPPVMGDRNYHIYTSVWTVKKYPPLYMFPMFHSSFCYSYGPNYVTGMNASNLPNYPKLDKLLESAYYAPSIYPASQAAILLAQGIFVEECISIPIWSTSSYMAYRKGTVGVVNMFGYGLNNKYTYLNAYNVAGGPIVVGLVTAPSNLNPLYCPAGPLSPHALQAGWQVMSETIYPHLMNENPYDLSVYQPWVAQDWEVGTWVDPNPGPDEPSTKSTVTYYLRKDVGIAEPGTGIYVRNLNAHDVEFSIWYPYAFDDGWNWHSVGDLHHTEIIDQYTIKLYFDHSSYWFPFEVGEQLPILAKDELIDTLCTTSSASFTSDGSNCTTGTHFKLTTEQIVQVTSDDLTVDYVIFGGYEDYEHNWIWLQGDLPAGTHTVDYYTDDLDPRGYYLAGLPWTSTWYSAGLFYPIAITPGLPGPAVLGRNTFFFLDPPLGELDWRWRWNTPGGTPGWEISGRDSGYFQINIYDVVRATASYGHSGDGAYDPQYFPGADIDKADLCHIGIYDIVTVTGKYGLKWGYPPP